MQIFPFYVLVGLFLLDKHLLTLASSDKLDHFALFEDDQVPAAAIHVINLCGGMVLCLL